MLLFTRVLVVMKAIQVLMTCNMSRGDRPCVQLEIATTHLSLLFNGNRLSHPFCVTTESPITSLFCSYNLLGKVTLQWVSTKACMLHLPNSFVHVAQRIHCLNCHVHMHLGESFWRSIKGVREIKRRLNDFTGFLGSGSSCCVVLDTSSDQVLNDLGALVGDPGGVQEAPAWYVLGCNFPQDHPKAVHVNLRHHTAQITGASQA